MCWKGSQKHLHNTNFDCVAHAYSTTDSLFFIFIGFIAQPLHTALTMIFYTAMVFCLITTFMLLYASIHSGYYRERKKKKDYLKWICISIFFSSAKLSIFVFFLFTIAFFGFTFLRITVVVGDTESSRIPGFIGSLMPSILIAILGIMAKKLLDGYGMGHSNTSSDEDGDKSTQNSNESNNITNKDQDTQNHKLQISRV